MSVGKTTPQRLIGVRQCVGCYWFEGFGRVYLRKPPVRTHSSRCQECGCPTRTVLGNYITRPLVAFLGNFSPLRIVDFQES